MTTIENKTSSRTPLHTGFTFFTPLGLILYATPFTRPSVEQLTRPVTQYLLFTLVASITTLLIIAYHFHRLSLIVNPPEWIAALHTKVLLLSVAALNSEGLPSLETLEAVQGYTLLQTDRNG